MYVNGAIPSITENAVVISNHQCVLDWIVADFIALRYVYCNFVQLWLLKFSSKSSLWCWHR